VIAGVLVICGVLLFALAGLAWLYLPRAGVTS
jgi:hypothetical protein